MNVHSSEVSMDLLSQSEHTRPLIRVLIFGHKDFSQLMSRAIRYYTNQAQFHLHDAIVGSASEVKPLIDKYAPHVIVSAGANAAYLRSVLSLPVVSLEISDDDWADALERAAKVAQKVDTISFDHKSRILPLLAKELGVDVEQHVYHTSDQAREKFHIIRRQQPEAIIGASLVCGLANQFDLPSFLVYSEASCRRTLEQAIEEGLQNAKQGEANALTHWLLNKSKTPIILSDSQGASCTLNKAAKQALGIQSPLSLSLQDIIGLAPQHCIDGDGECQFGGKEWWFHCDQVDLLGSKHFVVQFHAKQVASKTSPIITDQQKEANLVYSSPSMHEVIAQIDAFSASPGNVLVYGESGTGKEVVARRIHQHGPYAKGQFVAVNCGAIPADLFEGELFGYHEGAYTGSKRGGRKGLIESARDGVLFLDEISELHPLQQTKLLRFIQERRYRPLGANAEIDIELKLVAASNRPLEDLVASGEFRSDLFYRLNVFKINVPALRYRPDDIESIAITKLTSLCQSYDVQSNPEDAFETLHPFLLDYPWPGNIRELENILERVVAWLKTTSNPQRLSEVLRHIVPEFTQITPAHDSTGTIQTQESQLIIQAMQQLNGDRRKVAAHLGISPTTLWRRLKKLNYKD
ncbi:AAA family ATPase [Alteromonas sediminis]|uniref:AAA family ATPase n=1 Tax=Alteromonas sediminis TaxID=2259342 RepID=A0A3N5XWV1_9ALTE|nr:sigma 54-interacting transcriptional regulator [Alteromonas sediminis]RPJ65387.1 AAA family ATPase [Alteromonas sediminis]